MKKEMMEIIEKEKLSRINWYESDNLKENEVGIAQKEGKWIVYVTDERANIVDGSVAEFSDEEEAIDMLLRKARYAKKRFG